MLIPVWYIPSFYGDIKLETINQRCRVITENLTVRELEALKKLQQTAIAKGWLDKKTKPGWANPTVAGTTLLAAPIDKVAGTLSRLLKPDKKIVSAVKFADGSIEEIRTAGFEDAAEPAKEATNGDDPYRTAQTSLVKAPKAATSVAAPVRGCPVPDFATAEIKARRVLAAFLDPDQLADFQRYNRFVSIGQATGHRYMVTSRHANDELALRRTVLYDLDDKSSMCTHDWLVPAAEELLALHVFLQIPDGERFLRLPAINVEEVIYEALHESERAAVNQLLVESGN